MDAETGEKSSQAGELESGVLRAQHEVPVQRVVKIDVQRSDGVPYAAPPKHRFLRNIAGIAKRLGTVRRQNGAADFRTGVVDEDSMPVDDVDIRPFLEVIGDIGQCPGKQGVVTVEVGHDIAIDAGEALIDRIGLAFVRRAPPTDPAVIALENVDRCRLRIRRLAHGKTAPDSPDR